MADLARALASLLGTYYGRDSIIRIVSYGASALGGIVREETNTKLQTISQQLSAARTILRLFDDVPMLLYNLRYLFGHQEETRGQQVLGSLTNILYQIYFPVEHIAWASDKKLINVQSAKLWVVCLLIWAVALISSIFKALLQLRQTKKKIKRLRETAHDTLLRKDGDRSQEVHSKQSLKSLKSQEFAQILSVVKHSCDLMNAINWLPPGILWSQKFTAAQSGLFGTISSFIMVWENYIKMKLTGKKSA